MVVLPECFNSPYGVQYFAEYAESLPGAYDRIKSPLPAALPRMPTGKQEVRWTVDNNRHPTTTIGGGGGGAVEVDERLAKASPTIKMLSDVAKQCNVVVVGGSMPERDEATAKLYNTSCVLDQKGRLISMHRKLHLFDIDIPGGITFQESQTLTAGDRVTVFDCDHGRFGLGICYDLRFPEPAMIAARLGAGCLIYPGAFNTTTGPVSWELLQRARATDNQCFVVACSPARPDREALEGTKKEEDGWRKGEKAYPAWGYSAVVGPRGEVKARLEEKQGTLVVEMGPEEVEEVRRGVPISMQRRFDVYPDVTCG
ncbi:Omega-amidase nit3 [Thecaphora frezii]